VGTVTDQSKADVAGAAVTLVNVATGTSQTVTSNTAGQYAFPTVTPGTYNLAVTKQGFRKATVSGLVVDVAKSYTVNVPMQLGEVAQTVTVEAGTTVQLETTTAQVRNVIDVDEMDHLPTLQHGATELIGLQPGVSRGMGNNTFPTPDVRAAGAMDDQNTYAVDGIDISNNLIGAVTWVPVQLDSVQEGRHGTNDFHGSVYWYHQNSALNAIAWDNDSAGIPEPKLIDNRGGVRVGGPIFKNKTFRSPWSSRHSS
jgi:Carboxypeptidase regulatory-like domain